LTRPPKVWAPLEVDDAVHAAHKFVEHHKERLDSISAIKVPGLTIINPNSKEQDIIKIFNLLCMYPVEIVLMQIELPELYKLHIRCEAHPRAGHDVRVDILLEARTPRTATTIAVMEIKGFGLVRDQVGGILYARVDTIEKAKKVKPRSAVQFKGNSKLLLKQCATYARRYGTRHVALCDWSVAVYFDFKQLAEAGQNSAGDYVLCQLHTDHGSFHYALLAFFKRAVDEWLQGR